MNSPQKILSLLKNAFLFVAIASLLLLTFKYNISEYRFHLVGALTLGIVFLSFYLGNQFENAKKSELSLLISKKKNKRPKKEPSQAKSWGQVINEAKTRDKRNEY